MENRKWFKTYMFIWAGQFASTLTSYAVQFAIIIWLSLEYQSPEVLAYAAIAAMLPQAIIGLIAGVYVDRLNRKYVMIFSDAFIALCAVALIIIIKGRDTSLIWIYALLGLRSVGNAFHAPALQAIAPQILPKDELTKVAGINQVLQSVCSIGGPALGTLAIIYLPVSEVLYLDLFGALLAIFSLIAVKIPNVDTGSTSSVSSIPKQFIEGFTTISQNNGLRHLFICAMAITFVVMPAAIMFPLLTKGHYAGGKWEMGIIETVWGTGMLIGGAILSIFKLRGSKVVVINTMYVLLGLTFIGSGVLPANWFAGFVFITIIGGISISVFNGCFTAIVQIEVKPEKLGRVFSLYYSLAVLPSIVGLLFTGLIAETIGVNITFIISGCLAMIVGMISFCSPGLMQLGKIKNI